MGQRSPRDADPTGIPFPPTTYNPHAPTAFPPTAPYARAPMLTHPFMLQV